MIKRLRIKFIVINMLIVTIMLGAIFGLMYVATSINLERDSIQMMERIAMDPMQMSAPSFRQESVRLPYFSVKVDKQGSIKEVGGGFFDLSDSDLLSEIVDTATSTDIKSGKIKEYNLRYIRFETPMGDNIVFADMSSEQSTLLNLVKNFTMIGIAAFLVFLGISIALSFWAVKPVDEAWKQQKQFVADASHELKTPLTVIMTNAELIDSKECKKDDMRQYAENITAMSKQMRGLVESLLELANIDNGNRKTPHEITSYSDIVSASAMMFEVVYFEKEMTFNYDIEPNIMVDGDETQLKQTVDILLDNASKYASAKAEVKMSLKKLQRRRCLLEVSNQGKAIDEQDLKQLFKRFYRADKARKMNHSYGLGLAIAKSIVDDHQGNIWAESKDGWNSFYIELPIKE